MVLCFSSCKKSKGDVFGKIIKKVEEGDYLDLELIFECENPLVAIDSDSQGNFYLVSYGGDIFKISRKGATDTIYSGISCCGFGLTSIAVLPDGDLIVNDCIEDEDVLFRVYKNGGRSELVGIESNVLSLSSDISGKIFVGSWVSEGNLTVNFNPNRLSAAEYIEGKVFEVDDGKLEEIYSGGLPMCMNNNGENTFAAVWGGKGSFEADERSYSVADLRHTFWITLTEDTKIISFNSDKKINTGDLKAISSFVFLNEDALIVHAIPEVGGAGLFLVKDGADPIDLMFSEEKIDHSITGLEVYDGKLYFINVDGNFYKVKL